MKGNGAAADLRKALEKGYGKDIYKEQFAALKEDEIIELAVDLRTGLPVVTPVFDGARETDLAARPKNAGLNATGQATLIDRRPGAVFDRPGPVGKIYILTLTHLVTDQHTDP